MADSVAPREQRTRRRRRRRVVGFGVFLVVAAAAVAGGWLALSGGDSSSPRVETASTAAIGSVPATTLPTASTHPPFAGSYAVTSSVNVRAQPSTTAHILGAVGIGHKILVVCVTTGDTVNGPNGPSNKWLRVTGLGPVGYVSAPYVDTGADLANPEVIPVCTSA